MSEEVVGQLLTVIHVEGGVTDPVAVETHDGVPGLMGAGVVDEAVLVNDGDLQDSSLAPEQVSQIFHGHSQTDIAYKHREDGAAGIGMRGRGRHPGGEVQSSKRVAQVTDLVS